MSFLTRFAALGSLAVLVVACGGKVVFEAGTTAADTTTGGGGGAGGGTTGKTCGGKLGTPCEPDEYCKFSPTSSCGGNDIPGTCTPKPTGCPADCPGVCGCDGGFYCNECEAAAAGTDVSGGICGPDYDAGAPPPPVGSYSAYALATDLPRYVILKTESQIDRCVRITLAAVGAQPSQLGIQTTMGWTVEAAEITPHASDCALSVGGFPVVTSSAIQASAGKGDVKQDGTDFPCWVNIHVALTFPTGAPWVPPSETLDADQLIVAGGVCGG